MRMPGLRQPGMPLSEVQRQANIQAEQQRKQRELQAALGIASTGIQGALGGIRAHQGYQQNALARDQFQDNQNWRKEILMPLHEAQTEGLRQRIQQEGELHPIEKQKLQAAADYATGSVDPSLKLLSADLAYRQQSDPHRIRAEAAGADTAEIGAKDAQRQYDFSLKADPFRLSMFESGADKERAEADVAMQSVANELALISAAARSAQAQADVDTRTVNDRVAREGYLAESMRGRSLSDVSRGTVDQNTMDAAEALAKMQPDVVLREQGRADRRLDADISEAEEARKFRELQENRLQSREERESAEFQRNMETSRLEQAIGTNLPIFNALVPRMQQVEINPGLWESKLRANGEIPDGLVRQLLHREANLYAGVPLQAQPPYGQEDLMEVLAFLAAKSRDPIEAQVAQELGASLSQGAMLPEQGLQGASAEVLQRYFSPGKEGVFSQDALEEAIRQVDEELAPSGAQSRLHRFFGPPRAREPRSPSGSPASRVLRDATVGSALGAPKEAAEALTTEAILRLIPYLIGPTGNAPPMPEASRTTRPPFMWE